jgi:hypothetical protein
VGVLLMRFVMLLALAAFPFSAKADFAFATGNALLQQCESRLSDDVGYCVGAISAYSDMLGTMNEICSGKNVNARQVVDVVLKFHREHPADRDKSAASLARAALVQAFPCR